MGNKSRVSPIIWKGLGDIKRFVDPFAGSGSIYITRPPEVDKHLRWVVLGDASGYVSNYLRAIVSHEQYLYDFFSGYVHEERRHIAAREYVKKYDAELLHEKLLSHPNWCDPELAACWMLIYNGGLNRDYGRSRTGCAQEPDRLLDWKGDQNILVRYGDWEKCVRNSMLDRYKNKKGNVVGVVLDPPYSGTEKYYKGSTKGVAAEAYEWATEQANEDLRIAYCCYSDHFPCPEGWTAFDWKGRTFNTKLEGADEKNKDSSTGERSEVIYFSPHSQLDRLKSS